jgi:hypothetical protein
VELYLFSLPYVFLAFTGTILGLLDPEVNPLNAELNPICHLLALLRGASILVVSRLRVKGTTVSCNAGNCLPVNTA